MKKQLAIAALIIALFLLGVACLAINLFTSEEDYRRPERFGSYPVSGMYTFNPETIFESLEQGRTDVFTPYFGNPDDVELYYDPLAWSQLEYLRISDELSREIWNVSLGSEDWNIESVFFEQNCMNNPQGFNSFHIVYFQDLGVTNWKRNYTTRLLDIQPWRGLAYWGGDAIFSSTLLSRWENIGLKDFLISADDALRIAEEHGGNETDKSHCTTIGVNMYQGAENKWNVDYFPANFAMYIDAFSGEYEIPSR